MLPRPMSVLGSYNYRGCELGSTAAGDITSRHYRQVDRQRGVLHALILAGRQSRTLARNPNIEGRDIEDIESSFRQCCRGVSLLASNISYNADVSRKQSSPVLA